MARIVPVGLRVLAPCLLISIGAALAEDSPPNAADSAQFIGVSDAYSADIIPAQVAPPPVAAEALIAPEPRHTALKGLYDISSPATVLANEPPVPVAPGPPIAPQHVAVSAYGDGDSLGSRNIYADSTFAPFGLYESGIRFRAAADKLVPVHNKREPAHVGQRSLHRGRFPYWVRTLGATI